MRTAAAQVNTPRLTLRISLICTIISNKTCILVQVNQSHLPPPEKLLGDGFSTPMPLFCLICTIISNKTCILVQVNQSHFTLPANAVPHTNESCHTYEWEGSKVSTLWVSSQLRRRMSLISHISFTHEWVMPHMIGRSQRSQHTGVCTTAMQMNESYLIFTNKRCSRIVNIKQTIFCQRDL